MRSDVEVRLAPGDRERLQAVVADRNSSQKHVWRARIILAKAGDLLGPLSELPASAAQEGSQP